MLLANIDCIINYNINIAYKIPFTYFFYINYSHKFVYVYLFDPKICKKNMTVIRIVQRWYMRKVYINHNSVHQVFAYKV